MKKSKIEIQNKLALIQDNYDNEITADMVREPVEEILDSFVHVDEIGNVVGDVIYDKGESDDRFIQKAIINPNNPNEKITVRQDFTGGMWYDYNAEDSNYTYTSRQAVGPGGSIQSYTKKKKSTDTYMGSSISSGDKVVSVYAGDDNDYSILYQRPSGITYTGKEGIQLTSQPVNQTDLTLTTKKYVDDKIGDLVLDSDLSVEVSSRIAGDASLQTELSALTSSLSSEINIRVSGDASLSNALDFEVTRALSQESGLWNLVLPLTTSVSTIIDSIEKPGSNFKMYNDLGLGNGTNTWFTNTHNFMSLTNASGGGAGIFLSPFTMNGDLTITSLAINITTISNPSKDLYFAIYDDDGNGKPNQLISYVGTLNVGTLSGNKIITGLNIYIPKCNRIWIAVWRDASQTFSAVNTYEFGTNVSSSISSSNGISLTTSSIYGVPYPGEFPDILNLAYASLTTKYLYGIRFTKNN